MKLTLFNSLTRKKETFTPINQNLVKMYVCGPTVYDHPHIGNARSVVIYDVLYRILMMVYGKKHVRYVRNITDIDDKIIIRAKEKQIPISELTKITTEYFHHDMDYLGCLRPNIEPKATQHIKEMIEIIESLLEKDFAYKINDHVYFDITKFDRYTELSGRTLDEMLTGVRIETNSDKKHPGDFVLWKPADDSDDNFVKFASPFGVGRPGWHIECSAMSYKYLSQNFDIHGGGVDLIFPHHTNEIAQSCCAFPDSTFANFWVHNGFLTVNHEKMSKSLGNFTTVKDLIDQNIKGDVARLFLLSSHYRKPLDYNEKAISDADKTLHYWYRAIENLPEETIKKDEKLPSEFVSALLDDMNTTLAIKIVNDYAKEIHTTVNKDQKIKIAGKMLACTNFLGLMKQNVKAWFHTTENTNKIEKLITQRLQAKNEKNWDMADSIRNQLTAMGIVIEDHQDGTCSWRKIK